MIKFPFPEGVLRGKLNEVLSSKKSFISDKFNLLPLSLSLLINIIHWVMLLIKIKPSASSIVLHYNVVYGVDLVDKASFIYTIPATALAIFLLNLAVSNYLYRREKLAAYFLNLSGIMVQIIFLVATLSLIVINGQ